MHHAEERLGIKVGSTTPDGLFTLEHAECQAACTEAPCLQVNYRYRYRVTTEQLDRLIDDLAARRPRRRDPAPRHRRPGFASTSPSDRAVGPVPSRGVSGPAAVDPRRPSRRGATGAREWHASTRTRTRRASSPATAPRDRDVTRLPLRGLATRSSASSPPAATRACRRRWPSTPAGRPRGGPLGDRARPRRRRVPGRREVGAHAAGRVAALPRRQRRRERARHLQGPPADGARSAPADRGLPDRLLRRRPARSASSTSAARWRSAQERVATALNEAYAAGYVGKNILGTDFSVDIVMHVGRRRLRRRRGDGAHREPRGQPRACPASSRRSSRPPSACTGSRRSSTTSRRWPTCRGCCATARPPTRRSAPRRRPGTADGRRVRSRQPAGRVRDRERHDDVPRPDLRPTSSARASATAADSRRSCPAAARRRGSCEDQLDLPVRGQARRRRRFDARVRGRSW